MCFPGGIFFIYTTSVYNTWKSYMDIWTNTSRKTYTGIGPYFRFNLILNISFLNDLTQISRSYKINLLNLSLEYISKYCFNKLKSVVRKECPWTETSHVGE